MSNIEKCLNCGKRRCDNCLDKVPGHTHRRGVHKLDLHTEEIVDTFSTIVEAARITGIPHHQIKRALKIEGQPAGGYYWKYANEVNPSV